MNKFRKYIKIASQIARKLTQAGRAHEIKAELARLAFRLQIDETLAEQANKIVTAETSKLGDTFVEEKFILAPPIKTLSAKISAIRENFDKEVFEIIRRGNAKGESDSAISDRIARLGRIQEQHIETLINTIRVGIARQGAIDQALTNGVKYFRYVGAHSNARLFCRHHIDKIYSLDEIRKMDNGQGLPVEYFCGGYNCRHRWVPFLGEIENGVAIHESWQRTYDGSDKQTKQVMANELNLAKKLANFGKVELNLQKSRKEQGDTDIYFEGEPTQVKQTQSQREGLFRDLLRKGAKQADTVIIEHIGHPNEKKEIREIKKWLFRHPNKKLFLYNITTNQFIKV